MFPYIFVSFGVYVVVSRTNCEIIYVYAVCPVGYCKVTESVDIYILKGAYLLDVVYFFVDKKRIPEGSWKFIPFGTSSVKCLASDTLALAKTSTFKHNLEANLLN